MKRRPLTTKPSSNLTEAQKQDLVRETSQEQLQRAAELLSNRSVRLSAQASFVPPRKRYSSGRQASQNSQGCSEHQSRSQAQFNQYTCASTQGMQSGPQFNLNPERRSILSYQFPVSSMNRKQVSKQSSTEHLVSPNQQSSVHPQSQQCFQGRSRRVVRQGLGSSVDSISQQLNPQQDVTKQLFFVDNKSSNNNSAEKQKPGAFKGFGNYVFKPFSDSSVEAPSDKLGFNIMTRPMNRLSDKFDSQFLNVIKVEDKASEESASPLLKMSPINTPPGEIKKATKTVNLTKLEQE